MPAKITNVFSITIRPRHGIKEEHKTILLNWVTGESPKYPAFKALVTLEGATDTLHFQTAFILQEATSSQNIKRHLLSLYKHVLDAEEMKHAIRVTSHNDERGLLGYCLKELMTLKDIFYRKGYTDDELQDASAYYKDILKQRKIESEKTMMTQSRSVELIIEYANAIYYASDIHKGGWLLGKHTSVWEDLELRTKWLDSSIERLIEAGYIGIINHISGQRRRTLIKYWKSLMATAYENMDDIIENVKEDESQTPPTPRTQATETDTTQSECPPRHQITE